MELIMVSLSAHKFTFFFYNWDNFGDLQNSVKKIFLFGWMSVIRVVVLEMSTDGHWFQFYANRNLQFGVG